MNKKTFLVLIAALLVFSGVALANTAQIAFERGLAYQKGIIPRLSRSFARQRNKGILMPCSILVLCMKGTGHPTKNLPEAIRGIVRQQNWRALIIRVNLGLMYEEGRGVSQKLQAVQMVP